MQGKTLRYIRQSLGLTQNGFAQLLGTTQLSICKYESDSTKPKASTEKHIKRVLGVTDEDIFEIDTLILNGQHKQLQARLRKKANI